MAIDNETMLRIELECARNTIRAHLTRNAPERRISGIAISSMQENSNGQSFLASGCVNDGDLPVLIADHDYLKVLGAVTGLRSVGDQILFDAVLLNSGRLAYADMVWGDVILQYVTACSIGPRNLGAPPRDGLFECFAIDEISLVTSPADPGATIVRVSERAQVVYLDNRPREIIHWELPR